MKKVHSNNVAETRSAAVVSSDSDGSPVSQAVTLGTLSLSSSLSGSLAASLVFLSVLRNSERGK